MGLVKSMLMESEERGWDAPDKFVCADCVEDSCLKDCIRSDVEAQVCDYCGHQSHESIATPLEVVMYHICDVFFTYFFEPDAAGLPRDSGNWIFEITETADALESLPLSCNEDLFQDIVNSFHYSEWIPCARGHWLDEHASTKWRWDWEHFEEMVKTKTRYFFASPHLEKEEHESEYSSPSDLLNRIGSIAGELRLYQKLKAGTSLCRVREANGRKKLETFEELGPPPPEKASAGRMNPAGISYFYLAREQQTAIGEVLRHLPCQIAVTTFSLSNDLTILDLTALPEKPSVFDMDRYDLRETVLFLEEFVKAISKPIAKNGQEHVDYVPSQVVSEFFAKVFTSKEISQVDGIIYPSVMVPGGQNVVIFPPRELGKDWANLVTMTGNKLLTVEDWKSLCALIFI